MSGAASSDLGLLAGVGVDIFDNLKSIVRRDVVGDLVGFGGMSSGSVIDNLVSFEVSMPQVGRGNIFPVPLTIGSVPSGLLASSFGLAISLSR